MTKSKPALGFIGMGLMGAPMTRRLLEAGYEVAVWNRSAGKAAPLIEAGARAGTSPKDVAENADITMMCLTAAPAVEAVVFGGDGVAKAEGTGKLLVDFSSMRPDLTAEFSARLREANEMGWIDAPVSGGVPGAEQGTLAIMAGGDAAEIERVRPVVMALCQRLTHMGASGAGQTTKLVNQMIVGCNIVVVAEALAYAARAGVDAAKIPDALAGGFADSIPFQLFGPRFAAGTYEPPLGELALMTKDLGAASGAAAEVSSAAPMTSLALELMRLLEARGHAHDDITVLRELYGDKPLR
ncbi:MAG: NAD(P)-dependent oxidoreductase [Alphaproteobacteria bacterium]